MKKILSLGSLLLAVSLSACAVPGLGPNYAASDAYVREVLSARDPEPTPAGCATARSLQANRDVMRQSDRDYLDRKLARCNGAVPRN
jgi:hypothetical protein